MLIERGQIRTFASIEGASPTRNMGVVVRGPIRGEVEPMYLILTETNIVEVPESLISKQSHHVIDDRTSFVYDCMEVLDEIVPNPLMNAVDVPLSLNQSKKGYPSDYYLAKYERQRSLDLTRESEQRHNLESGMLIFMAKAYEQGGDRISLGWGTLLAVLPDSLVVVTGHSAKDVIKIDYEEVIGVVPRYKVAVQRLELYLENTLC